MSLIDWLLNLPARWSGSISKLRRAEFPTVATKSTTLRKLLSVAIHEWKLDYYAKEYARGRITMARAAEEAAVPLWEMLDYARRHKIPAQYSLEDLQHDIKVALPFKKTARKTNRALRL